MISASQRRVVEATRLTKRYGTQTAVDGIDFHIFAGECLTFLGPNGAGKSSTLRLLAGIAERTSGELRVAGLDPHLSGPEVRGRIGVVPQEENLDPDLTVLENMIVYGRYFDLPRKVSIERGMRLLDFVHLVDKSREKIETLSGGMKRRLLIARALINQPEILILDEPTTGLDPQARRMVWQKLRHLKEQGTTLILTTHSMDEAQHLSDRVLIMDHGRILAAGTPADLVAAHAGAQVLEVQGPEDRLEALQKKLVRLSVTTEIGPETLFIFAETPENLTPCLEALSGETFLHRKASLEDVFFRLAGHSLRE